MAKRMTDSEKWKKTWIRKLSPEHKLFWVYILDSCDHAGILDFDLELFSFMLGVDFDIEQIKEDFGDKLLFFDNNNKIFIPKFIDFQYGYLKEENKVHNSVINLLKKQGLFKGLDSLLYNAKDKDKEKDKVKVKDKAKEKRKYGTYENVLLSDIECQKLVSEYGEEKVKHYIDKISNYQSSHGKSYKNYSATIRNWIGNEKPTSQQTKLSAQEIAYQKSRQELGL